MFGVELATGLSDTVICAIAHNRNGITSVIDLMDCFGIELKYAQPIFELLIKPQI